MDSRTEVERSCVYLYHTRDTDDADVLVVASRIDELRRVLAYSLMATQGLLPRANRTRATSPIFSLKYPRFR